MLGIPYYKGTPFSGNSVERLYKVLWVSEKEGSRPGFGMTPASLKNPSMMLTVLDSHQLCLTIFSLCAN